MVRLGKAELRRLLKGRLKALSKAERLRKNRQIQKAFFARAFFKNARTVLFYVSLPEEVDTWPMMERALKRGKRVLVPSLQKRRIVPSEVRRLKGDLRRGAYGIFEPRRQSFRPVGVEEIDLVVVPGIGFDRRGRRLGRGGGYYDRFLKRVRGQVPLVGLAFKVQRLERLPVEVHDVPVDYLICA